MATPFIGEIRIVGFSFVPNGWAACNGQLLNINDHDALFALIGTTYGGDGQTTFAVPDLRGRIGLGLGSGFIIGEQAGQESVTLTQLQIPAHSHTLAASAAAGKTNLPQDSHFALIGNATRSDLLYGNPGDQDAAAGMIGTSGSGAPHENRQPFLCMNYIISLFGIFPPQN